MSTEHGLTSIALVMGIALTLGLFFERFRQPSILGYILTGVVLGPSGFAMIQDRESVTFLAELGVLMLLFLLGMELSLRAFRSVLGLSLVVTFAQIILSGLFMWGVGHLFDLSQGMVLVMAFSLALSSTAVAIKMLENIDELRTGVGKIAVGVLIAQDLAIVPMIVILKSFGGQGSLATMGYKLFFSVALLAAIIVFFTRKHKVKFPYSQLVTNAKELVPLAGLALCFGAAALSGFMGLSAAYGSFLAGLILGNTTERHTMVAATKPIQSVLLMVFFLSIGLLLDLSYIFDHLFKVLLLLLFITIGKTAMNIGLIHLFRQPWRHSFMAGLALSQVGEFTFLLSAVGNDAGLMDAEGQKLIVSLAALSLALSPLWFTAARRMHDLAPVGVENLRVLVTSVYGRELTWIEKALKVVGGFFLALFSWIKGSSGGKDSSSSVPSLTADGEAGAKKDHDAP